MASIFKSQYRDRATGKLRESKNFMARFRDEHGRTVTRSTKTANRGAAWAKAHEFERAARLREELGHTPGELHRRTPLGEHLDAWEQAIADGGASVKHARVTANRVRKALEGIDYPREIDPVALQRRVATLTFGDRNPRPFSAQTRHAYVRDCKAFTRWLFDNDRAERDWLGKVRPPPVREKKRRRRALPADDLRRLLETTRASRRPSGGLAGPDRWALYLTAMATGFRVRELASLTAASFDLAAGKVRLAAAAAKNKKAAAQQLPPDVVEALRPFLAGKAGPLWPGVWWKRSAEMLRPDLKDAGIPYVVRDDAGSLYADFHALRHSAITLVARVTKNPKLTQEFARHSSPVLTLAVYTHVEDAERVAAMAAMPRLTDPLPSTRLVRAGASGGQEEKPPDSPAAGGEGPPNGGRNAENVLPLWPNDEKAPPGFEPGMVDLQSAVPPPQTPLPGNTFGRDDVGLVRELVRLGLTPALAALVLELSRQQCRPAA
jgi:integrase